MQHIHIGMVYIWKCKPPSDVCEWWWSCVRIIVVSFQELCADLLTRKWLQVAGWTYLLANKFDEVEWTTRIAHVNHESLNYLELWELGANLGLHVNHVWGISLPECWACAAGVDSPRVCRHASKLVKVASDPKLQDLVPGAMKWSLDCTKIMSQKRGVSKVMGRFMLRHYPLVDDAMQTRHEDIWWVALP